MILWTHLFSLGLAHLLERCVARLSPLILEDDVAKGGDVDAELARVQIYSLVFQFPVVPGIFLPVNWIRGCVTLSSVEGSWAVPAKASTRHSVHPIHTVLFIRNTVEFRLVLYLKVPRFFTSFVTYFVP